MIYEVFPEAKISADLLIVNHMFPRWRDDWLPEYEAGLSPYNTKLPPYMNRPYDPPNPNDSHGIHNHHTHFHVNLGGVIDFDKNEILALNPGICQNFISALLSVPTGK